MEQNKPQAIITDKIRLQNKTEMMDDRKWNSKK